MKMIILLFFFLPYNNLFEQRKDKISYKADELKFRRINNEPVRTLITNVEFTQGSTKIICDSANFFTRKNILEAYGNILITNSDSSTIKAKFLTYNGDTKIAKLRDNVIYKKNLELITTNNLDYNIEEKKGYFFSGGELRDDENILTSNNGIFFGESDLSVFYSDVELAGKDFILNSDSMTYNTFTKEAITFGYTEILSDDSIQIKSLGGSFIQESKDSRLESSKIETKDYILEADIIDLDEVNSTYYARNNVKLKLKETEYIIQGELGVFDKVKNKTKIFGNTLLKKNIELDTFYLSSDTILALNDENEIKKIFAYNDVKFFNKDFIGKADSIIFLIEDSTIEMYLDPIIWNNKNQITSDTIKFNLNGEYVEEMKLSKNSFIISQDTLGNFNQIKGRNMDATFINNTLDKINVYGNGETIYFGLNEDLNSIIGLNYIICSDLRMNFSENELENIIFYKNPRAKMIPPHEITNDDLYLTQFKWREEEIPKIQDVVYYFRKKIYLRDDSKVKN